MNVVISYTLKRLGIVPFLIHSVYCVMFYTKMNYVFAIHKPETLNLTDDEQLILKELAAGKLQKEIEELGNLKKSGCKELGLQIKVFKSYL